MSSIAIGALAGLICYGGILLKEHFGYDDALDVVAVHGLGGLWGAIATGIFATVGAKGLIAGNAHQVTVQAIGAVATIAFSFIVSVVLFKLIDATIGLRVSEEEEMQGLDQSLHGETGYYLR